MSISISIPILISIFVSLFILLSASEIVSVSMNMSLSLYTYIYIYIYTHTHTHNEASQCAHVGKVVFSRRRSFRDEGTLNNKLLYLYISVYIYFYKVGLNGLGTAVLVASSHRRKQQATLPQRLVSEARQEGRAPCHDDGIACGWSDGINDTTTTTTTTRTTTRTTTTGTTTRWYWRTIVS